METRGSNQESAAKKKKTKKKAKTPGTSNEGSDLQQNKNTSEHLISEKESPVQQQNNLVNSLIAQKPCVKEGSIENPISIQIGKDDTLTQVASKKKKKKKKKGPTEATDTSTAPAIQTTSCTSNGTPMFICNPEITITPINPVKKKKKKKKKNKSSQLSGDADNAPDTGNNEVSLCSTDLIPTNTVSTVTQASSRKNSVNFNNQQSPLDCVFPPLENTKRAKDSRDVILVLDGVVVFPQLQNEASTDSVSSGVVSITKSGNITEQEDSSEKKNISYQGTKETNLLCTEKNINGKDIDLHNSFSNKREQKITEIAHYSESEITVNRNTSSELSKSCSCVEINLPSTANLESVKLVSEGGDKIPESVKMPESQSRSKGQSATNCAQNCDQKAKALLKAERRAAFEAQRAVQLATKKPQDEDQNDDAQQKSKAQLRAERRALQEAQRAAKSAQKHDPAQTENVNSAVEQSCAIGDAIKTVSSPVSKIDKVKMAVSGTGDSAKKKVKIPTDHEHGPRVRGQKFRLFSHLPQHRRDPLLTKDLGMSGSIIHPAIIRVGLQMSQGIICGSTARCLAMLAAFKEVIKSYVTPSHKELSRDLESKIQPYISFLARCRPLSVSMDNAVKFLKFQITHISPDMKDFQAREKLCSEIDTFINNEIYLARDQIAIYADQKINDDDVILTYACSSLVKKVLCAAAHENKKKFRVIVVDARPKLEGREMLRYLIKSGIQCSYVLINSVSYVMKEVSKVILGAHSLQANGYVMSRVGSSQVALVAHAYNVPVLVCCETYKFCERAHTDSFVYNELGNPDDLVRTVPSEKGILQSWREIPSLRLLNVVYDVTPPDLVAMVIYEKGMLPCTSVPVVLRVKHAVSQETS